MNSKDLFRRKVSPCSNDPRVLIDSELKDHEYVKSFGFEWTKIDGFIGKESMSHGHIFGRFLLPNNFFQKKVVLDVGCGNGRIGRLIAPHAASYIGCDLSEAVYAFPNYLKTTNITLVRASGTDLPFNNEFADVAVCWGVLHHMNHPYKGLDELFRVVKPGGEILIFIYSKGYDSRENLNRFVKNINEDKKYEIIEETSDFLDGWREVDSFYANELSKNLSQSVKQSREWQIFQWFDGISPDFHWSLEEGFEKHFAEKNITFKKTQMGCYRIKKT